VNIQCRSGMRIVLAAVAVLVVAAASGCAPMASPPPTVAATPPEPSFRDQTQHPAVDSGYLDAVTAFQNGDMEGAAVLFEQAGQTARAEPSRRRALSGLAGARLLLAPDEKGLAKAGEQKQELARIEELFKKRTELLKRRIL